MVREAATACGSLVQPGNLRAIEAQALTFIPDELWQRATRSWTAHNCTAFARLADAILRGRAMVHSWIGKIVGHFTSLFGVRGLARQFAEEIGSRIPLPFIDDQATIVARGIQAVGIVMCALQGRDIVHCACFRAVVLDEGKARVEQLLTDAAADWTGLARLVPAWDIGAG